MGWGGRREAACAGRRAGERVSGVGRLEVDEVDIIRAAGRAAGEEVPAARVAHGSADGAAELAAVPAVRMLGAVPVAHAVRARRAARATGARVRAELGDEAIGGLPAPPSASARPICRQEKRYNEPDHVIPEGVPIMDRPLSIYKG